MEDTNVGKVLKDAADRLDAVLYGAPETYRITRPGVPQRYIFMTDPPDSRLWLPGDDINLICLTDNKAQTFWSFIAEKKNDESLAARTLRWATRPRMADEFNGLNISNLPGGGHIHLQYASLPAHFDLALIEAYGMPGYQQGSSASTQSRHRLESVRRAVKAQPAIDDATVHAYRDLRAWLENAGLFSKDFGPLDPERLLRLVLALDKSDDIVSAFASTYADSANLAKHDLSNGRLYHVSNNEAIAAQVARRAQDQAACTASMDQYAALFCQEFEYYIQLKCRCWDLDKTTTIRAHIVKIAKSVRLSLSVDRSYKLHIWPTPFRPRSSDAEKDAVVVLLYGVKSVTASEISTEVKQLLVDRLEAYAERHWDELECDTDLTEVVLLSRSAVQDYEAIPVAALDGSQRVKRNAATHSSATGTSTTADVQSKLRPAGQTLSRLRWDPRHQSQQYEVGYVDRFDGLKWIKLEDWGRPIEEEDFIPEHRIQQIRKAGEGRIVWDRAKKIDLTGHV